MRMPSCVFTFIRGMSAERKREEEGGMREMSKKQKEKRSWSAEALIVLASARNSGGRSTNCDDISIYISQLAGELIF